MSTALYFNVRSLRIRSQEVRQIYIPSHFFFCFSAKTMLMNGKNSVQFQFINRIATFSMNFQSIFCKIHWAFRVKSPNNFTLLYEWLKVIKLRFYIANIYFFRSSLHIIKTWISTKMVLFLMFYYYLNNFCKSNYDKYANTTLLTPTLKLIETSRKYTDIPSHKLGN